MVRAGIFRLNRYKRRLSRRLGELPSLRFGALLLAKAQVSKGREVATPPALCGVLWILSVGKYHRKTIYFLFLGFLFLKILLLNRIMFRTAKKRTKIISVSSGFVIASVAKNIIGKPNTIAGKF